jgi:hypothetical protein
MLICDPQAARKKAAKLLRRQERELGLQGSQPAPANLQAPSTVAVAASRPHHHAGSREAQGTAPASLHYTFAAFESYTTGGCSASDDMLQPNN